MKGGLAHGLSGVPFWSHDTGGFAGRPSDDLFLRWAQFGALSPLLRFHGTTSREPWRFPAVEAGVVDALKLRYRLLPYIYSAALRSGETGEPIMRALMMDSPADPAVLRLMQRVLDASRPAKTAVNVCGKMSGEPIYTLLLVGMGLRQLSATPHNIPEVKKVIRTITVGEAEQVAREALRLETARDVTSYLREQTRRLVPDVVR